MGDMGELFRAHREARRDKRAGNRDRSAALLTERGISFESKNNGAHLIVENRFDFWPGTGKWIDRESKRKGRGVWRLVVMLEKKVVQGPA